MQSRRQEQCHLSTVQVAKRFGVTRHTVVDWIHEKKLPATRIGPGGHFRINPADVETLLGLTRQSKEDK